MRVVLAFLAVLVTATGAAAHMVVLPSNSVAGAAERYMLLVPTEGKSPTVRVELRLPMGVDVAAVESKPGWQASNQPFPLGAATVRWAGGRIPPGEMLSFEFLAINPPAPRALTWNATQWYEDGSNERWGQGAPADHEASTTTLRAADAGEVSGHVHDATPHDAEAHGAAEAPHAPATAARESVAAPSWGDGAAGPPSHGDGATAPPWLTVLSLVLSVTALVVALGARRR